MQNGFDFRKIPMGAFRPSHKKYHGHVVGGSIIGSIIGTAISTAINETVESYAGTVERARTEEQERARIRSEYNKKWRTSRQTVRTAARPPAGKCTASTASRKSSEKDLTAKPKTSIIYSAN